MTMMRPASFLMLVSVLALAAGCPGSLENPDRFAGDAATGGDGGGGGGCDAEQLFMTSCGTAACHEGATPQGGLDLVSPGVAARVLDAPGSAICMGRLEVDSMNPSNSLILEKVQQATPSCGAAMPYLAAMLSASDIACIETWVNATAGGM